MSELPTRREPPRFRTVQVAALTPRSPHLVRVTLQGDELEGFDPGLPAASVRLLLPRDPGAGSDLVLPSWNGNEFLYDDGGRPPIRTLTPLRFDPDALELDLEVVRHGEGALSRWVDTTGPGQRVAVSGTGRGFEVPEDTGTLVLAGDESALPAICTIVYAVPAQVRLVVIVEIAHSDARIELPAHERMELSWHDLAEGDEPGAAMAAALRARPLGDGVHVWAAGEAAGVQRIRRHLFDEVGLPRSATTVRGYWKLGRVGAGS